MIRAIWPSVANIPNRLPEGANITTSGEPCLPIQYLGTVPQRYPRHHVLLHLLDHPIPLHVHLPPEAPLYFRPQERHCPRSMARNVRLGNGQSAPIPESRSQAHFTLWERTQLGVAKRPKQLIGNLRDAVCEHS